MRNIGTLLLVRPNIGGNRYMEAIVKRRPIQTLCRYQDRIRYKLLITILKNFGKFGIIRQNTKY